MDKIYATQTAEKILAGQMLPSKVTFTWFRQQMTEHHEEYLTDDELATLYGELVKRRPSPAERAAQFFADLPDEDLDDRSIDEVINDTLREQHERINGPDYVPQTKADLMAALKERGGNPADFQQTVARTKRETKPSLSKRAKKAARRARRRLRRHT